jgi:carbonic anhydrase
MVIGCSDSRASPDVVFGDNKVGYLFGYRAVGGALGREGLASAEYAVAHLGVKNIVFMSHSECGAVKEAQHMIREGHEYESVAGNALMEVVLEMTQNITKDHASKASLPDAIADNALAQADKLYRFLTENTETRDRSFKIFILHHDIETGRLTPRESFTYDVEGKKALNEPFRRVVERIHRPDLLPEPKKAERLKST